MSCVCRFICFTFVIPVTTIAIPPIQWSVLPSHHNVSNSLVRIGIVVRHSVICVEAVASPVSYPHERSISAMEESISQQVGPATSATPTPALATSPSASLSPKTSITWRCPVAVNIASSYGTIYSLLMLLLIGPLDLRSPRPKPSSDPCSHQFAFFAFFSPPCIRSIEPLISIRDKKSDLMVFPATPGWSSVWAQHLGI
ncbi:hypothetical protein EAE96_010638 [Botrytis aclada]|nr:hypothetical protein EAE96_010638 [Botrytis aclada]